MENENIKQTQKSLKYVLIGFVVFQIIFLVFINLFLKTFFADMGDDMMSKIAPIAVNVFALIIGLVTDIAFVIKIKRYDKLENVKPVYGVIEDIVILTSTNKDNADHDLCFLIRNNEDGKLYFSEGDDDMSAYSKSYSGNGRTINSLHIMRRDGKETNIGDTVRFYILEKYEESPKLEILNDYKLIIKGRRHLYQHINQTYDINVFEKCVFYKGYVELL